MNNIEKYFEIKIGMLQAIGEGERRKLPSGQKPRTVRVVCDCGITKDVLLLHFSRGRMFSCGCVRKTMNGESNTDLGKLHRSIRWRCSKKAIDSKTYYDRGIRVCDEWVNNYASFKEWCINNGYKKGLQIDRIDNDKGYSPDNCRFVTAVVNQNNKRDTFLVKYNGVEKPFLILMRELNLFKYHTAIRARIVRGWDVKKAIETPIRKGNYRRNSTTQMDT